MLTPAIKAKLIDMTRSNDQASHSSICLVQAKQCANTARKNSRVRAERDETVDF